MSEGKESGTTGWWVRSRDFARREWPLLIVLLVVSTGTAVAVGAHWKRASFIIGCGVALGAVLRLVLSTPSAGMLAVRAKWMDVLVLGALAGGIIAMTLSVPPMRPR